MCTKGSGTNSVKPPVSLLQGAHAQEVPRPVPVAVDVAEHDGGGAAQAHRVRRLHHLEPLRGVDLVGAEDGAHLVVEDLGRRAGQAGEARVLAGATDIAQREPQRVGAVRISSGEKACTWMSGAADFTASTMAR